MRVGVPSCRTPGGNLAASPTSHGAHPKHPHAWPVHSFGGFSHDMFRKRSFRRALNQASRCTTTLYKGKSHTLCTLGQPHHKAPQKPSGPPLRSHRTTADTSRPDRTHRHLRVMTYNAGGLSTLAYDEFMTWVHNHELPLSMDVICVQETHWPADCEYNTPKWFCMQSGISNRSAGVLTLISTRLCRPEQIRHCAVVAGRLQHVKLSLAGNAVDILNIYQHCWSFTVEHSKLLQQRGHVWDSLASTISSLPKRNALFVLGDFNTAVQAHGKWIGTGCWPAVQAYPDLEQFTALLLEGQDLVLLNSWRPKRLMPTYFSDCNRSQIDFILTRRGAADKTARMAGPHTRHIHAWRGGGYHVPVTACVRSRVFMPAPQKTTPKPNLVAMHAAWRSGAPSFAAMAPEVQRLVRVQPCTAESLNSGLLDIAVRHFPTGKAPACAPALGCLWQEPALQQGLRHMWSFRKQAQACLQLDRSSLKAVFLAFRHMTRFLRLQRALQRDSKQRRKAKYQEIIGLIEEAANRHDPQTVYKLVKRLAPKTRYHKISLRDSQNCLMTPGEELQAYRRYCIELFQSDLPPVVPPCQSLLRPYVLQSIWWIPQYAYTAGRCLEGALIRAASFCAQTRQALKAASCTLHQRHKGLWPDTCAGGAVLAIDLSKAFDKVRRADLLQALQQADVPADLTQVIMALHNRINYHLQVGSESTSVACRSGVRQGCVLAPFLFNLLTAAIVRRLACFLPSDLLSRTLTMFADDTLGTWSIRFDP